uniref:Uncharacterized protein n=1 Tax=Mesocestoides corti TaxID=53468 RepID=A0A5K3EV03_MESCO
MIVEKARVPSPHAGTSSAFRSLSGHVLSVERRVIAGGSTNSTINTTTNRGSARVLMSEARGRRHNRQTSHRPEAIAMACFEVGRPQHPLCQANQSALSYSLIILPIFLQSHQKKITLSSLTPNNFLR